MKKSVLVVEVENGYIIQPYAPYMNKGGNETWIAKDLFDVREALEAAFGVNKPESKNENDTGGG